MKSFLVSFLMLLGYCAFAQAGSKQIRAAKVSYNGAFTEKTDSNIAPPIELEKNAPLPNGRLIEVKDERIDLLLQDYLEQKKNMGYRIQLFSGNVRWDAMKVRIDFLEKYGKMEKGAYLVYQSPNFKIRIGDYRDRLQAQKYLEIYKDAYPSAFIVQDEIAVQKEEE